MASVHSDDMLTGVCQDETNLSRVDIGDIHYREQSNLPTDLYNRYASQTMETYDEDHQAAHEVETNGHPTFKYLNFDDLEPTIRNHSPLIRDSQIQSAIF